MIERIEILASVIDMSSVANELPLRNMFCGVWKKNIIRIAKKCSERNALKFLAKNRMQRRAIPFAKNNCKFEGEFQRTQQEKPLNYTNRI